MSETAELTRSISELLKEVRGRGDAALTAALARFDGVKTDQLRVSEEEIRSAESSIDSALSDAIDLAMARVAAFNEQIVRRATWRSEGDPGSVLGEIGRPIESVGLFVPSGKGACSGCTACAGCAGCAGACACARLGAAASIP